MEKELLNRLKSSNKVLQILLLRQRKGSHSKKMITVEVKANSLLIEKIEK